MSRTIDFLKEHESNVPSKFQEMRNGDVKTVNGSNGPVTLPCHWLITWR